MMNRPIVFAIAGSTKVIFFVDTNLAGTTTRVLVLLDSETHSLGVFSKCSPRTVTVCPPVQTAYLGSADRSVHVGW